MRRCRGGKGVCLWPDAVIRHKEASPFFTRNFCSLKSGNFETRYFTGNIHCKISIYIPVLLIIPLAPYSTLTVRTSTVRRSTVRHVGYFVPRTECTYSTVLSTGTHLLLLVRRTGTRPYWVVLVTRTIQVKYNYNTVYLYILSTVRVSVLVLVPLVVPVRSTVRCTNTSDLYLYE